MTSSPPWAGSGFPSAESAALAVVFGASVAGATAGATAGLAAGLASAFGRSVGIVACLTSVRESRRGSWSEQAQSRTSRQGSRERVMPPC
jgi:hypothetical protein